MRPCLKISLLATVILIVFSPVKLFAADCESIARLVSLEGTIEYKTAGNESWQPARLEQNLCNGDALRSDRESRAAIRMINDTLLRLDRGTAIIFTSVVKKDRSLLDLLKGAVHFISRVPRSLEIKTPYVNAAIEGTEFVVTVKEGSTEVTVYEGKVVARNDSGSVELTANQTGTAASGQAPLRIVVAQPRDAVAWALYYPPLPAQQDQAGQLAHQAIDTIVKNNIEQAATFAEQAIAASPQSAAAFMAQSYVDQARFDIPAALENSRKAAELAPQDAITQARLAEVLLMTGDTKAARQTATAAVDMNPSLAHTQTVLGFSSLRAVNLNDAASAFEKAIQLDSAAPLPRLGLGLVKIRRGDLKAGREEIETAALLDPNNALLRSYMGKAYYEEKRSELASEQFAMAKDLDPNDPTAWFYDSILLQSENRPVEALQAQQKAIALNDNRGVYRSRQLLDEDEAARNVALARIYSDLGFEKRALLEGTRALENDPANFSAHRFLSEIDASLPKRNIASESELLQSRLLQPLNKQILNPQLSNLQLSDGPSRFSYNEFNPLFNENGVSLLFNTFIAEKNTLGDDLILSYLANRYALSLAQYHFESDGFRETDNLEKDIINVIGQFDFSENTSLQLEFRKDEQENGDLQQHFFPDVFIDPNQQTKTETNRWRVGFRHDFSPNSKIIGNALFFDVEENRKQSPFFTGLPLDTINADSDSHTAEVQYLHNKNKFVNLVTGIASQRQDQNQVLTTHFPIGFSPTGDPLPPFTPFPIITPSLRLKHDNVYLYNYIQPIDNLSLTLGISYDDAKTQEGEFDQVNPKFGFIWNASSKTSIRGAAYRTFKRTLFAETLEPTQVAGFNQLYDDLNSTDSKRYGIALDHAIANNLFLGASYLYSDQISRVFIANDPGSSFNFDTKNHLAEAYFYWTITPKISLRVEYEYDEFKEPPEANTNVLSLKTHRVPIGLNYFLNENISAGISTTYYYQEGQFFDFMNFVQPQIDGKDDFWLVDVNLNYKLPKRLGKVGIGVKNLFDQSFQFEDRATNTDFNPVQNHNLFELSTDRSFYGKFSINF